MSALDAIAEWPCSNVAAAVVGTSGVLAEYGDTRRRFRLASVTKPLVARAVHVAVEEGVVELDTPAGPPGSTVRHLLSHASGLSMRSDDQMAEPGKRRVYSNYGFQVVAETVEQKSGIEFSRYLGEAIFEPLGMAETTLGGGAEVAGFGASSTVADLAVFAGDLLRPATVSTQLHDEAISVQFPGLDGVLPGFGVQRPNDWGLGFEIRDDKSPHWTGATNSGRTYGHFGQSGTFIWVDPARDLALVVLADRNFDDWARDCWPRFSDTVLAEFAAD
ncbi:serine hydrolase domain-containing protein [Mycobacterium sp.]|jgi:CubicO group peptidase (beta-lactamase class C family)|uniref:serine hydrolase domain-containing protein n=1 Tax=Mycobacterium sp. TaxID=1785 RepID=UPI002D2B164D|nr:serine hydrolase domain-containing protein [Mycobacterium sp.]HZA08478.1 serine hydrolase domain-containing protein [Mycobacterium sp.]